MAKSQIADFLMLFECFACVICILNSKDVYISHVPSRDLSLILDNGIVRSFVDCVQSCVQRSDCFSVFFTAATKLCDRNSAELPPNATRTDVPVIWYADFGLTQNPGVTTTDDIHLSASPLLIAPGDRVKRGPTWEWGDQDGGDGNLGTVDFFDGGYWWRVTWDLGHINYYRMGDIYQDLIIVG
ncbi:hypothetical protein CHS0354_006764 [Potamilus streckersoni]|uniref:MIB/HERC2 domain-containing protein n=1 Tax=Potamilus streckersoni TaxID=2493646 RepID=A0AAE0S8T6_9BIVA|nr:hypothetical protein CHS0354_006764 [Potamilus streckersoni]